MNVAQMAQASGASVDTVRRWAKQGMPKPPKGFDGPQTLAWLRERGLTKPARKLAAYLDAPTKGTRMKRTVDAPDGDSLQDAAERARSIEKSLYAEWRNAKGEGRHDAAADLEKRYLDAAEQRRKIEKDLPDGQTKAGEALPRAEVERTWCGVATALREDMLAIPVSLAPRLVGRSDVAEISAMLDDAVRDALRHVADRIEIRK